VPHTAASAPSAFTEQNKTSRTCQAVGIRQSRKDSNFIRVFKGATGRHDQCQSINQKLINQEKEYKEWRTTVVLLQNARLQGLRHPRENKNKIDAISW